MKNLFKQLKDFDKKIKETEQEINTISTLPFYQVFGKAKQKEDDLRAARETLHELIRLQTNLLNLTEDFIGVKIQENKKRLKDEAA